MGWLITLGILTGIGLIPLGIRGGYDNRGALIFLYVGPVYVSLYPRNSTKKGKEKKNRTGKDAAQIKNTTEASGGKLADFFPLVKTLILFLGELIKKIKVKNLDIRITLGGGDPYDLSVNYGRTCAAVANLQPHFNRLFDIKRQNISVNCDYTAEDSVVTACLDVTICLARFSLLIIRYGIQAIKQYFIIHNEREGGVKQ